MSSVLSGVSETGDGRAPTTTGLARPEGGSAVPVATGFGSIALDVEHRLIVITGASAGIGARLCDIFAAAGATVVGIARRPPELWEVSAQEAGAGGALPENFALGRAGGERFARLQTDVSDGEKVASVMADVISRYGVPDAVVANAAIPGPPGSLWEVERSEFREAFTINVLGVVNAFASATPAMLERGSGTLIALSGGGVGGPAPQLGLPAYVPSKAAVSALVEGLAMDLRQSGVNVNALSPGRQPTRFLAEAAISGVAPVVADAASLRSSPDTVEVVAKAVSWLMSPGCVAVSGHTIAVQRDDPSALLAAASSRLNPSSAGPEAPHDLYRMRRIDGLVYHQTSVEERP